MKTKTNSSIHHCMIVAMVFYINSAVYAQWIQQGPGPSKQGQVENITDLEIVGAINCVAPHPTNADILYIGGVNGGVWSTSNATAASPSWTFLSNDLPSQSIGALEFDPTDATNQTLVVGLGRTSSFGGFGVGNRGVFRTTTGAGPWTNIDVGGTFTNVSITGIAARGAVILVSASSGIWRTINTGGLWTQISGAAGTGLPAGNSRDLVADPNDNNVFYTNSGTNGIYRSDDMGATWNKVSDAALDADLIGQGNIEIAVGQNNNVFVAIVRGGILGDVYRSGNSGGSWTPLDIPVTTEGGVLFGIHPGGQGGTHLSLAADPTNDNIVYIGGDRQPGVDEGNPALPRWPNSIGAGDFAGRLFRIDASLAAGTQVTPITNVGTAGNSSPHGDSREMDFDANGDLLESDDGGIYKQTSPINATGDWFSLIGNTNVTEVHSIDWDRNANIIIAGVQDNGTPQQDFPTNSNWTSVMTADGGDVAVDDISSTTTSTRYSSFQNLGSFWRRVYTSGNVLSSQSFPALTNTATGMPLTGFSFVTPIKVNNQNGQRLIISANAGIFESLDQGNTVTNVSGTAANNSGADAIAYGASDNVNILYVGAGTQVLIRDAAAPDALTASVAYPGGFVQGVTIDPNDSQSAYVIDVDQVFETTNEGGGWGDITGNLMALNPGQLRSIAYISNSVDDILAVGADFGVFIAAGPAFNTWAALGTNLPRVAVMDLEFDVEDGMLVAGTMGRGAWTFNLSERNPVDLELVLDYSGSMLSPACGTCDTKLNVLKDAVEIFMKLWQGLAVENDRMGVVYFRTNISKFSDGGSTLLSVIDKTDAMVADVQAQTSTPSDLTALGGGLQSAITDLTDATRPRHIILFTDGMQNVDPGVVYPGLTIEDDEFSTNSNVSETSPVTTMNNALGIKVNTIGVGATSAFESQLADIAAGTGGLTKLTTAPDEELRRFFVEELVDVLRAFSPQLIAYRKGTVATISTEEIPINLSVWQVIFKVSYQRGDKMTVNVYKGKTNVTKLAKITNGEFYQIFSFPFERLAAFQGPDYDGPWTVQMRAQNVAYELAAIADEATLKYDFSIDSWPFKAGQPLQLKAKVLVNDELIVENVAVTAKVSSPGKGRGTLLSEAALPANPGLIVEPNFPLGAQKMLFLSQQPGFYAQLKPVDSGITLTSDAGRNFAANFTNTKIPGTYTVTYSIKGTHPYTGPFERVEQRVVNLRFSGIDLEASELDVRTSSASGGNSRWTWLLTPKDKFGNFLGPDYGDMLSLTSTNSTVEDVRDNGDGTYEIDLIAATGIRPDVVLNLYDETWYDGPLPEQDRGGLRKWYGSIHAGASVPLSPFSNVYSTGLYGKVDLEYRMNPVFALQLTGGINSFESDLNVLFGAIQAKAFLPLSSQLSLFAEAGPGVYAFEGESSYSGLDIGAGLDYRFTSGHRISIGSNYITTVNQPDNAKWLTAGIGLHFGF